MRWGMVLLAAFALSGASARAEVAIAIDKSAQQMTVTVDGELRYTWPVSTGKRGHDTPAGEFKPFRMERSHFSREWDDAPMPHSIFFTQEGHAIHGSYDVKHLGSAASHGCVRLSPQNAATLYTLVREQKMANVHVTLSGAIPAPMLVRAQPGGVEAIMSDEDDSPPLTRRSRARSFRDDDERGYRRPYYPSRNGVFPFPFGF